MSYPATMSAFTGKIFEWVESILPEGTPEQKQRLAVAMCQMRAEETQAMATMFKMNNPTNGVVDSVCRHMLERVETLQMRGLEWAKPGGWPPPPEAEKERMVMLQ